MSRSLATRNGRELKAFMLDGQGMRAIPLDALTSYDIDKWFAGTDGKAKDASQYMQRVATLFRCIEMRMQALGGMPRQIEDAKTGEVLATANFPTPQYDEAGRPLIEANLPFTIDLDDLLTRSEIAQVLLAKSYWYALRNRVKVTEVRWLDPRTVEPKYSKVAGLMGFARQLNGRDFPIAAEDMAYVWRPGLSELGPGIAPGQVAARQAGIADNMDKFLETFFERGAMPTTIVFADNEPPPQEKGRIKAYLERVLTGIGNAFGIEVLSQSLRFEQLTPPLKDMIIPDIKDKAQREICIALGVPLSLIFSEAANRATAEVDDLVFYTKTMVPEAHFVAGQVNKTFFSRIGLRLVPRPDQLEIFQQQEIRKSASAIWLFDRGAIDEDELRQAGGYQPRQKDELDTAVTAASNDAPENIESVQGLNGAQITAAASLLRDVTVGAIAPEVARELLITLGINTERAGRMVDEAQGFTPQVALEPTKGTATLPAPVNGNGRTLTPQQETELKQWERKVMKRFPDTRPYTIPFEPRYLKGQETAVIRQRLLAAQSAEEVKAAFVAPFWPEWATSAKTATARGDNDRLTGLEETAVADIEKALRDQLEAVRSQAPGGASLAAIGTALYTVLSENSANLQSALTTFLLQASSVGAEAAVRRIGTEVGVGFSWNLANTAAAEWVDGYAFDLVTGINETTADRLRRAVKQWITDGGALDDLANDIRPIFANEPATRVIEAVFNVDRATMIAETEATRAYAEGKIAAYTASDVADNPPIVKPPDDSHVRCRCDVDVVKYPDGSWHWVWFTANDDLVCDICGPLHLQSVGIAKEAPQ